MTFRNMERTDIPAGLSLCRSAGWNQLSRDWEIFLTHDPQGNRVCVNEDGNVVGTVTTIRYGQSFAWIGMVLVDPAHQRRGIGLALLEQAVRLLKNEHCVKLDATPAGRQVYTKLGFEEEYGLSRMSSSSYDVQHPISCTPASVLNTVDLESVISIDREAFGAERAALLSWMLAGAPGLAFKVSDGNQLKGYCFGRHGHQFEHIGPVVASNVEAAKGLVAAALKYCGDKPVILDIPHHDQSWRGWLESVGFSELRPFIRMYKGTNLSKGIPENQYAMLGPEFG